MTSPFDFFDRLYCIHLPREVDRERRVRSAFESIGVAERIEFVAAAEPAEGISLPQFGYHKEYSRGARGGVGCTSSHLKALAHASSLGARNVLILEDDVEFTGEAAAGLARALTGLPIDWDLLYLGGRPFGGLEWATEGLARTVGMSCTHAYALNGPAILPAFDALLDHLTHWACDQALAHFASEHRSYCVVPPVCHQAPGKSAIEGRTVDFTELTNDAWRRFTPASPTT